MEALRRYLAEMPLFSTLLLEVLGEALEGESFDHNNADEMRPEYDFRSLKGVVRGKYAERYRERLRVVRLADDVAAAFDDEEAVNSALRQYLQSK